MQLCVAVASPHRRLLWNPAMRKLSARMIHGKQIAIQIGDESRCGECAWLGVNPDASETLNLPSEVRRLFRYWLQQLLQLREGAETWLPYDFADEQTGWICFRREGNQLLAVCGTAAVEGWEISLETSRTAAPQGFRPDEPLHVQEFYLPRIIADLRVAVMDLS